MPCRRPPKPLRYRVHILADHSSDGALSDYTVTVVAQARSTNCTVLLSVGYIFGHLGHGPLDH